jgi:hypothetical protein
MLIIKEKKSVRLRMFLVFLVSSILAFSRKSQNTFLGIKCSTFFMARTKINNPVSFLTSQIKLDLDAVKLVRKQWED